MAPVLAPLLQVLSRAHIDISVLPEALLGRAMQLYAVIQAGIFDGRVLDVGDVVVCAETAIAGAPVVLVARGHGGPRLGSVRGAEILGDAGEPCSGGRWRIAGHVERILHAAGQVVEACARFAQRERVLELVRGSGRAGNGGWGAAEVRTLGVEQNGLGSRAASPHQPVTGQLGLFERAA